MHVCTACATPKPRLFMNSAVATTEIFLTLLNFPMTNAHNFDNAERKTARSSSRSDQKKTRLFQRQKTSYMYLGQNIVETPESRDEDVQENQNFWHYQNIIATEEVSLEPDHNLYST